MFKKIKQFFKDNSTPQRSIYDSIRTISIAVFNDVILKEDLSLLIKKGKFTEIEINESWMQIMDEYNAYTGSSVLSNRQKLYIIELKIYVNKLMQIDKTKYTGLTRLEKQRDELLMKIQEDDKKELSTKNNDLMPSVVALRSKGYVIDLKDPLIILLESIKQENQKVEREKRQNELNKKTR